MTFIDQNDKIELEKILTTNLSKEKGEELVTSLAQAWKNEGKAEGIKLGEAKLVQTMVDNGVSIENISKMTKLPITKINELLKNN